MLTRSTPRSVRIGASALALATALVAGPAQAQFSYNAPDPTVTSGSVEFSRGITPGQETYDIFSPTVVLDFTPSDTGTGGGNINFQNAGTSVTYQGSSNFTVLNRIVPADPARAIQFNGAVTSQIQNPATGQFAPGGSVWFYSPGGIVLGSGAVFDVGSLLLATGDPTGGTGVIGATNIFSIASTPGSNAAITIQSGAQIKALTEGSYVAMVAPVVQQDGNVRVNGSAAYVAAEQATVTINQGLFDIDVVVGSDGGGTPLVHNGSTSGPSSTGVTGDNHGIYMVAVPKNTAITMLVAPTGQLGFDVAGQAGIENGAIYLRTADITGLNPALPIGSRLSGTAPGGVPVAPAPANIVYQPAAGQVPHVLSSNLEAQATTNLDINLAGTTTALVKSSWYSGQRTSLTLQGGASLDATEMSLVSFTDALGGNVNFTALAGSQAKFSNFIGLGSNGLALFNQQGPNVRPATGGSAIMTVRGATVTADGLTPGPGGHSILLRAPTGDGTGVARLTVDQGGQLTARSTGTQAALRVSATTVMAPPPGLPRQGGTASVTIDNGKITADNIFIDAPGFGQATDVRGGTAELFILAGGGSLDTKRLELRALTTADTPNPITDTKGGTARLVLSDTTATSTITVDTLSLYADGLASQSTGSSLAIGGSAVGGTAELRAGVGGKITVAGLLDLKAGAVAGAGILGGAGGAATSGSARIDAAGGQITFQNATMQTGASGGAGSAGPDGATAGGNGGNVLAGAGATLFASNGGSITGTSGFIDGTSSGGTGGDGFSGSGIAGNGGSVTAANVFAGTSSTGQITLQSLNIQANALAGSTGNGAAQTGGSGGSATAGTAGVNANTGLILLDSLAIRSDAFGGTGRALGANGGKGVATAANATATNAGTLKVTGGSFLLSAEGFGGDASGIVGGSLVAAGEGIGGIAAIFAGSGATIDSQATLVSLDASGDGGAEFGNGNVTGAAGRGGNARINANAGTILLNGEVEITADGQGGDGGGTGNGGAGIGGEARLGTFGAAPTSKVTVTGDLFLDASGQGGGADLGLGGDGRGGTPPNVDTGPFDKGAYLVAIGGEVSIGGTVVLIDASGRGGSGIAGGGAGVGGLTNLVAFGATIGASGTLDITSSGEGGSADDGAGGKGGAGTGGFVLVAATSGGDSQGGGVIPLGTPSRVLLGQTLLDASGEGGGGGIGAVGQAGGVGGDGTGGRVNALAQAGSGQFEASNLFLFLQGLGGIGGDGGAAVQTGGDGGVGGAGGVGKGGFTNFGTASGPDTTTNTGSATFTLANAFLNGLGGEGGAGVGASSGGAGGLGIGGNGALLSRGSPVKVDSLSIDSSALGGMGGTSGLTGAVQGAGGAAQGGAASILVTNRFNRTEPGSLVAIDAVLTAGAFGGTGATQGASTAGQAFAQVTKSAATLDSLSLATFGDAPPPAGSESGLLVDAGTLAANVDLTLSTVGDVQLSVINGGVIRTPSFSINTSGSLLPPAAGTPGLIEISGDFFASFGQNFVTTTTFAVAGSFSVGAGGVLQVGDVGAGADIQLTATGPLTTGNLAAGGSGSVFLTSDTSVTTLNVAAGDNITIFSGDTVATGSLTAGLFNQTDVTGEVGVFALGGVTAGDIKAAVIDVVVGDAEIGKVGTLKTGALTAETLTLDVAGTITTGNIQTADIYSNIDTTADQYLIGIGASGDIKLGAIDAFTSIGAGSVNGKLESGTITAKDSVMLLGKTGVAAAGVTTGPDTNDSLFISNTSIIFTNPDFVVLQDFTEFGGQFNIDVLATALPQRVGGPVTLGGPVTATNFAAATTGAFQYNAINAPRRLFLDVGGTITGGALTTSGALSLIGDLGIDVGNLSANTIDIIGKQNVTAGDLTAASIVNVTATGTATFTGQVRGQSIQVRSSDLSLGTSGRLGTTTTSSLTLISEASTTRYGGTGGDGGYNLDAAEAQRLQANAIELSATKGATIGQLALQGSGGGSTANLVGSDGRLSINASGGSLRVTGALTIANAPAGTTSNRLALNAGTSIEVVTDQGGRIAVLGSDPVPAGSLVLNSPVIRAASASLLTQLDSLTPAQRAQSLATPTGAARPEGWFQGNAIEFRTNQIFIQNSNTANTFGGFTGGTGTSRLSSRAGGTAPIDAIIFGRFRDSAGAFKINADALALLTLGDGEGITTVTSTSLFNNCPFTGTCTVAPPPPPPPPPVEEEEVQVVIDRIPAVIAAAVASAMESTAEPESVAALPTVNLVTTIDTGQLRTEPVISDPVTGGGNPSLWEGPTDDNRRDEDRPAPGGDGQ